MVSIREVSRIPDGGFCATIDGREVTLTGGDVAKVGDGPCDCCGRFTEAESGEFTLVVYGDPESGHMVCGECLELSKARVKS